MATDTVPNSSPVLRQRCHNHLDREAAARCPVCQRFYCRECVTEHEGRVMCASCLARPSDKKTTGQRLQIFLLPMAAIMSFVTAWLLFYAMGRVLLNIPSNFHDGTMWTDTAER